MVRYKVKVMSRHFLADFKATLQNILGRRLTGYEDMINKAIESSLKELGDIKNPKIEISEMTNGSMAVIVYGD